MTSRTLAILLAGAALTLLHMWWYYPFIADDAFISLRYSARLLEGRGLTWNDGERVEGYSNPLWVLLAAGAGAAGIDMVLAIRILGIISALLPLLPLAAYARRTNLSPAILLAGVVTYAFCAPVAMWAISGMETSLVALLFSTAALMCYPLSTLPSRGRALIIGTLLGLICWLRPEGPLYTIILMGTWLLSYPRDVRARLFPAACISAMAASFFFALLAFRLYYYGALVPNTVLAKVAFTISRLAFGTTYLGMMTTPFLAILIYLAFIFAGKVKQPFQTSDEKRFLLFLAGVSALICASVIVAGGDFFGGARPLLPLMPFLSIAVMEAFRRDRITAPAKAKYTLGVFLALHLLMQTVNHDNLGTRFGGQWLKNAKEIGLYLKEHYAAEQPLVAVYTAGIIPYYSGLPSLDVYGLNDGYLTHHKAAGKVGSGLVGHELFDVDYIESRKPGILIFAVPGMVPYCMEERASDCQKLLMNYREESITLSNGETAPLWLRK